MDMGCATAVQAKARVVRHGTIQEQRDRRVALVPGQWRLSCRRDGQRVDRVEALGRHDDALRLVAELRPYWAYSVRWQEGLRWTEAALERAEDASPLVRAAALLAWVELAGPRRGDRFRASLEQARLACRA